MRQVRRWPVDGPLQWAEPVLAHHPEAAHLQGRQVSCGGPRLPSASPAAEVMLLPGHSWRFPLFDAPLLPPVLGCLPPSAPQRHSTMPAALCQNCRLPTFCLRRPCHAHATPVFLAGSHDVDPPIQHVHLSPLLSAHHPAPSSLSCAHTRTHCLRACVVHAHGTHHPRLLSQSLACQQMPCNLNDVQPPWAACGRAPSAAPPLRTVSRTLLTGTPHTKRLGTGTAHTADAVWAMVAFHHSFAQQILCVRADSTPQ